MQKRKNWVPVGGRLPGTPPRSRSANATDDWITVTDANVVAPSICAREAFKSMREKGVDDVHSQYWYSASKFTIIAFTEGLTNEVTVSDATLV